jgi:hypothetical protein
VDAEVERGESLIEYVRRLSERGIIPLFANKGDAINEEERRIYTLGKLFEHVTVDSIAEWRMRYAPSVSLDDLYAGPVIGASVEVLFMSAGRATLTVRVDARRQRESETYLFKAQRAGPNDWYVTASSFTLD